MSDDSYVEEVFMPPGGRDFKKILVIDDITYVVKSISRILRNSGYFVITAMTGKEAIEKFVRYQPDLVTVDQKLPDMSGLKLVESIRTLEGGDLVKVIFISAVQEKEEIRSILATGVDNYLLKPFRKDILVQAVKKLIG